MNDMKTTDELYMRRCLQLAENGRANAKPNPMVGAVIVHDGRIIGEGYHVRYGEGHAEVNAFASVKPEDEALLPESTIYVSLEPCSHHGKTPPCADLVVRKGVRRCVCGCVDPNAKVSGRGIERIRQAGIDVTVGVLEKECIDLNRKFFTFHRYHRPYITLKWAQTADGFLDSQGRALAISTPFTKMLVHKLRAESDAILVGRITDEREHPALDVRHWAGRNPKRIVLSHSGIDIDGEAIPVKGIDNETINNPDNKTCNHPDDRTDKQPAGDDAAIRKLLDILYAGGIQSLLVEGGASVHRSFLTLGLWDEIRVETAPITAGQGTPAPILPANIRLTDEQQYDGNAIRLYRPDCPY